MSEPRGCCAQAEVITPDAVLRTINCGKWEHRHGWSHGNRQVHWRGRYRRPQTIGETADQLLREAVR